MGNAKESLKTLAFVGVLLLAAAAGGQDAATTQLATQPATQPAAETAATQAATDEAPAATNEATTATAADEPELEFYFRFANMPLTEVVRRFASLAGKPLLGDLNVQGSMTFFDSQPYDYEEALDMLNIFLRQRGYTLTEWKRYLRLMPVAQAGPHAPPFAGPEAVQGLRPGRIVQVVLPVKYIDSQTAAKAVVRIVSAFGSIQPLPKGNGVIVMDSVENIQHIREVLAILDKAELGETQIETIKLKHSSAKAMAVVISKLFQDASKGYYDRRQRRWVPLKSGDDVTALFDERTNMLFLRGSGEKMVLAAEMVHRLDVPQDAEGIAADLRIFRLEKAKAEEIARTVIQALPRAQSRGRGQPAETPISIVPDAATNRLVVAAPADKMPKIEELIRALDEAVEDAGRAKILHLKYADPQQMAKILGGATARRDSRGRRIAGLQVTSDTRTNTLIVSGDAGDIQEAEKLLAELDREIDPEERTREIHVVQLQAGDAREVARSLIRLFSEQTGGRRGAAPDSGLRVEAERATNSLIISCAPADWTIINEILGKIKESVDPLTTATIRLIPLEFAKAGELAGTIKQIFGARGRRQKPGDVPVIITASERANSLLISAAANDQETIAELVRALDVDAAKEIVDPVQIITLKAAEAERLAETLRAMIPRPGRGRAQEVFLQADALTNSVLVRAPESERLMIEQMIAKLDKQTQEEGRQTSVKVLKHVSASSMASMLGQLFPGSASGGRGRRQAPADEDPERVVIAAAPGDRMLVIDAPLSKIRQIEDLVATLDAGDSPVALKYRTYQLEKADAADLARSLSRLFAAQRGRPRGSADSAEIAARFEANAISNQLIVAATNEQLEEVEALIREVEESVVLAAETRTVRLKHAKSDDIADILTEMLPDDPARGRSRGRNASAAAGDVRVASLPAINAVVVKGPPARLAVAEDLIKQFDTPDFAQSSTVLKVVRLSKAQAQPLADAVGRWLGGQTRRGRNVSADEEPVTVTPEPNSNSLLLRGPAAAVEEAVAYVRELDAEAEGSDAEMRVYPLANAEAVAVAKSLGPLFRDLTRQAGGRVRFGGQSAPFSVAADERTNSLIVSTTPAHFASVEQILQDLDKAPERPGRGVEYIYLVNADATEVATALQSSFADRRGADKPVIEADYYSNAITVIAKEADLKEIRRLAETLDEAREDNSLTIRVVPLTKMRAPQVADAISRIYGPQTGVKVIVADSLPETQPAGGLLEPLHSVDASAGAPAAPTTRPAGESEAPARAGEQGAFDVPDSPPVTIAIDRSTNSLIISATRQDMENIQTLIDQLTMTAAAAEAEYKIYIVKQADPAAIARTLDELFNPRTVRRAVTQQRGRQQNNQRQQQQAAPAPPPVISVVADTRTRSLIVRAKPLDFEIITPLVEHLDQLPISRNEVRIFRLRNTNATETADNLRELFGLTSRGGSSQQASRSRNQRNAEQQREEEVRRMIEMELAEGKTSVEAGSDVSITANRDTNSIIVAASADAMQLIAKLVEELDQSAAEGEAIRTYPLKNAEVAPTVSALQAIFSQAPAGTRGTRGGAAAGSPDARVLIAGDEAGKLIIVSAPDERHGEIAKILEEIDVRQGEDQLVVQVYKLHHAEAERVAQALSATLISGSTGGRGRAAAGAGAMRVSADRSSNTVIVRASNEDHERIAGLVEQMDVAPTAALPPVRVIPLNNADPAAIVPVLRAVFGAAQQPRGRGRAATSQDVVIEGDSGARLLMVRADDETFEKVRELAAKLDEKAGGKATRTVLQLEHAQASSVAAALSQAFGGAARGGRGGRGAAAASEDEAVSIVAEPISNSLIVTANPENLQRVQNLLVMIDTDTGGVQQELLFLEHADADELAGVLSKMVPSAGRGGRGQSAGGVSIAAHPGSNALVLSGPAADLVKVIRIARDLDKADTREQTGVYILPLTNGDAVSVAGTVRDIYQQQVREGRRAKRTVEPMAVTADERANALIIAGSKEMYDEVSAWVEQVEGMKRTREPRIIRLEYADPAEVERAIQQLFGGSSSAAPAPSRQRGGRSSNPGPGAATGNPQGAGGPIETTVLEQQRSILVGASPEDYEEILALVKTLEEEAAKARRQVRVFTLENATNVRVAQALTQMYRAAARAGRDEDVVSVTALAQTNAVVVAAAREKMEEIAHLIEQLDTEEIAPELEFRIYPLTHATPAKILPALRQMLRQVTQTRPGEPIDVQADERTRSIIVTARGPVFDQVGKIIESLDKPPAHVKAEVLIVPLKKADAAQLADVLNEMLRPDAGGQVTPEARALQEQVRRLRVRSTAREDIPELDLNQPIKIDADPAKPQGSNALVITSTPDNLKALRAIVEVLDTVPIAEGVKVRLLHLRNADAQSVMTTVREIFTQGRQLSGKPGTTVAGRAEPETTSGKGLANQLNVSCDPRTNTVVLSGMEESLALAELIVKDLDRPGPRLTTDVRLFKLKHADAARLAPVLRAVFTEATAAPGTEGLRTQVTRLRVLLDEAAPEDDGKVTELPKAREALTIQADEGTNILVVAARSDVMPLIADVIETMDIPGAGALNTVRIFPLVNADATRLADVVKGLYTGPNASLIRAEDQPTVVVDTRTNALVISAGDKTFAMLTTLLKTLDARTPVALHDIRLLPLKNAEAATLASTLQKMLDARVQRLVTLGARDAEALRATVVADERSNALIVAGSAESFQIVKGLAEQLDGASPALGGQVQLFPLIEGNAGNVAATLTNLFNQRYAAARTADVRRLKPVILADLRTNSLLVAANADDTAVLKGLLTKLDVKLTDPAVRLEVIPLKFNDAGVTGQTIQSLFSARLQSMTAPGQTPAPQDRVDVATDALSNSLVISASKENLELIRGLLAKVDVEPDAGTIVRMFEIRNADAGRIAEMLRSLVSQGLYKPGLAAAGANARLAAQEKVAIEVDARTNVVIVSASQTNLTVLEQLITKLDGMEGITVFGNLQMYVLERADAVRLAQTLQQLFDAKLAAEQAAGTTTRQFRVSFVPDPRTNSLLVAGDRESFAAVEAMLKRLDGEQTLAATDFRVFHLRQSTATALRPMLQQLFDRRPTRGLTKEPVTILADPKVNALIVGATPEDIELAASLIKRLDVEPEDPGVSVKVFPLDKADATQVSETIQSLYEAQGPTATAGVGIGVDERINALVVSAGAADLARIEELVARLDSEQVARVTEIRVFPLRNADAAEVASILLEQLTTKPKPMTAESPNRQTLLQFVTGKEGQDLVTRALQEGVLITPDTRTNALVVSAPVENMPLLKQLIQALDAISPRSAEIRVFTLENADARQMAELLTELFRLTATTTAGTRRVEYTLRAATQPGASATLGSDEQYALSITVDVRTNSLLVGGTRRYVELVASVIEQLDSSTAQDRVTKVYRLRNAQASDIETAVRNFLDQERQNLTQTLGQEGLGAAYTLLEREVAIVAESTSNTLLISASPRYFDTVREIVEELDQPPPQVLIQVLLAEVALDDTTELGVDWNLSGTFGGTTAAGGTDFGVSAAIAQFGGLNLTVTGGDVDFFLRALESQGRMEVLSRPQILAADNQPALINVGQSVPIITNSVVTDEGNTRNTIEYRPVGIILNVTPRITPDGFVKLEVAPEISSLADSNVQVTEGVNAVIINERKAETIVSVQDGHTIIIGGLITTTDNDREDKVPVLGDLPLVGPLFKSTKKVRERRELLIIMTPHVLSNVRTADAVTSEQVKRLNLLREMKCDPIRRAASEALLEMFVPCATGAPEDKHMRKIEPEIIPLEMLPEFDEESNVTPAPGRPGE